MAIPAGVTHIFRRQHRPQVIHRGGWFCTAMSRQIDLINFQEWAKNISKVASGSIREGRRRKSALRTTTAQTAAAMSASQAPAAHREL
jgi:hypothetical protein